MKQIAAVVVFIALAIGSVAALHHTDPVKKVPVDTPGVTSTSEPTIVSPTAPVTLNTEPSVTPTTAAPPATAPRTTTTLPFDFDHDHDHDV